MTYVLGMYNQLYLKTRHDVPVQVNKFYKLVNRFIK